MTNISLLHALINCNMDEIKRCLSDDSGDSAYHDDHGSTILHKAIKSYVMNTTGSKEIIKKILYLFVSAGYECNAKDLHGNTLLHVAVIAYSPVQSVGVIDHIKESKDNEIKKTHLFDIVSMLLDVGINVNAKNNDGNPVLYYAVRSHLTDVIKLFVNKGADVNITMYDPRDKDDRLNPLIVHALIYDHFEIIKLLIKKGANLNAKNTNDVSALSLAKSSSYIPKKIKNIVTSKSFIFILTEWIQHQFRILKDFFHVETFPFGCPEICDNKARIRIKYYGLWSHKQRWDSINDSRGNHYYNYKCPVCEYVWHISKNDNNDFSWSREGAGCSILIKNCSDCGSAKSVYIDAPYNSDGFTSLFGTCRQCGKEVRE